MRRRPPSWLPTAPFTPSWFALIHISPETGIITRLRALIGHGRHQISFLLANLQNSFNSKCNGDWLRLIKVKLFKMLTLSHLTWLPLRPLLSANEIRYYQLLTNQIAGKSWDVTPVSPSRDVTPPCHATPRPCVTHHMSRCHEVQDVTLTSLVAWWWFWPLIGWEHPVPRPRMGTWWQ